MRIGIITGSGTYALPELEAGAPGRVATPFGDALVSEGRFAEADVVHVARHGEGHRCLSSAVTH
jgi:purine nucleoside phosphorylase